MFKYFIFLSCLFLFSCSIVDKQNDSSRQKVGHFTWVDAQGAVHSQSTDINAEQPFLEKPQIKTLKPSVLSAASLAEADLPRLKDELVTGHLGELLSNNINADSELDAEQLNAFIPEDELLGNEDLIEEATYTIVDASGVPTTYSTGENKGDGLKRKAGVALYNNPTLFKDAVTLAKLNTCCGGLDLSSAVSLGLSDNLHLRFKSSSSIPLLGMETSYKLIELDEKAKFKFIYFRSLLENGKFFIPTIVALGSEGEALSVLKGIVHRVKGENWSHYAYVDGYIPGNMTPEVKYLLIITTADDLAEETLVPKVDRRLPSFKVKSAQNNAAHTSVEHSLSGSLLIKHSFKPR